MCLIVRNGRVVRFGFIRQFCQINRDWLFFFFEVIPIVTYAFVSSECQLRDEEWEDVRCVVMSAEVKKVNKASDRYVDQFLNEQMNDEIIWVSSYLNIL